MSAITWHAIKAPFIATQLNSTQLNSTSSWVELRRRGVQSDTTQLNWTQLPVVDPPTARRRFWTSWPSWSSLWVMTLCMMQNNHEIREFVWLYDRIDIMESWTEELENKLIEL